MAIKKAKKAPAKKAAAKKPVKKAAPKKSAAKKPVKKAAAKAPAKAPAMAMKAAPKPEPKKNIPTPPKKPSLVVPKNGSSKQYSQSEFFDCVQGYCGFNSRKDAKLFFEGFTGMLTGALKSGYKVVLPGLGKFQVRRTKARKGINPATKQVINIPARKKVAFTPNKALKEAVL